ncbi:putative dehydrogenase [Humitalea rosea]|uniref:Putative dehydrogenase n=1 Tax=Humitalea rosea TaxID=990373 RepID=A0A2W7I0X0_9PROT|nr:Gfo/Idh/MocA family oxidoreductase [Humitalea rosea]PZW40426.1 putative dehydrogenase [Humitalea rosea]
MKIAFVGCGWVADYYMTTLPDHSGLSLAGVYDRDPAQLARFIGYYGVPAYESLDALLADPAVGMVVNLTNPRSHFEVSRAALLAGKPVYSEKPLAMSMPEAEALRALAAERGLGLAAAPCNHLSGPIEAMARELRAGRAGRVLMAQAEMDDGLVPYLATGGWISHSGAVWPAKDEFEIGCTFEHAGYQIAPLVRLFGPVRRVTAISALLVPEKGRDIGVGAQNPDCAIGVLEFDHGLLARITLGIVAPVNRLLRVVGTEGVLTVSDVWDNRASLRWSRTGQGFLQRATRKLELKLARWLPGVLLGRGLSVTARRRRRRQPTMDFSRGVAELAARIESGGETAALAALAVHVTEVTVALQAPGGGTRQMLTGL